MGGFLTIGYCFRTIGYFPIVFGLDGGGQGRDEGNPSSPPIRENPETCSKKFSPRTL